MDGISKHVRVVALEEMLRNRYVLWPSHPGLLLTILQRMTFSTVRSENLKRASLVRKRLGFEPVKVTELTKALPTNAEAGILDLHSRIKRIYARV